jgi:transglutaminase-like putative cysteine protease
MSSAEKSKKPKRELPPENSVALRVMCCVMAIIAISASFIFGESAVPTVQFSAIQAAILFLCIWLCIGGGIFSYHYREKAPPAVSTLIKVGAGLIVLNLARELFEANLAAMQFQFLRPLMHSLVAASVLTSFELRNRSDIISSATFGLLLLTVAAASGKSILFGAFVFLYICFGAALLMYSCLSQTRNESAAPKHPLMVKQTTRRSLPLGTIAALTLLPFLSVAAFCVLPRLDNEADSVSARMRTLTTSTLSNLRGGNRENEASKIKNVGPNRVKAARKREAARQAKASQQQAAPPVPPGEPSKETLPPDNAQAQPPPGEQPKPGEAPQPKPGEAPQPTPDPKQGKNQAGGKKPAEKSAAKNDTKQKKDPKKKGPKTKAGTKNAAKTKPVEDPGAVPPLEAPKDDKPAPQQVKNPDGVLDESRLYMSDPIANPEQPVFTIACTRSVYTKSLTMDHFDGTGWTRTESPEHWVLQPTDKGVTLDCPPMGITYDLPIMELPQSFKVASTLGHYVPLAGIPQHISLLQPLDVDIFANVRATDVIDKGTEYSVLAQLPVYSLDEMRKDKEAPEDPREADRYLQIPDGQNQNLYALAADLIGTDGNRFVKAERILTHLRKNYEYSVTPVPGGDEDENMVDVFLFDKKKGDCKAYASAFVMLCRAAEIPTRLSIGYLPGDFDPISGATHVKKKHSHAWAEAWIPPYGWVPFDATPTGLLPARPEEQYYNYERLVKEIETYSKQANSNSGQLLQTALTWFGYALAAAGLALSLWALYLAIRAGGAMMRSIAATKKARHPATKLKRRMVKRLNKFGVAPSPSDTGADIVAKLEASVHAGNGDSALPSKVAEFMQCYNATYFGQENKLDQLKTLDKEISKMCAAKRSH